MTVIGSQGVTWIRHRFSSVSARSECHRTVKLLLKVLTFQNLSTLKMDFGEYNKFYSNLSMLLDKIREKKWFKWNNFTQAHNNYISKIHL